VRILKIVKQAYSAILRNKGRSFLTILGVVIGIAAVITLVSLGNGAKKKITDRVSALGSKTIYVNSSGFQLLRRRGIGRGQNGQNILGNVDRNNQRLTLTTEDLSSIRNKQKNPLLDEASGYTSTSTVLQVNNNEDAVTVIGTDPEYFAMLGMKAGRGELFSGSDVNSAKRTVVLGKDVADYFWPGQNPVGQTVRLQNDDYVIAGVLKPVTQGVLGNPNANIYLPYTSLNQTFQMVNFSRIIARARTEDDVGAAKTDIQNTLLANHNISDLKDADFTVNSSEDLLKAVNDITGTLTTLLACIAAISLLVGGIGIMNIMLVSVAERTREIGLRMAVGARTRDILWQFIFEAVLLTLVGGVVGFFLGVAAAKVIGPRININAVVTTASVVLAVGVAAAVGLIFGIYPASKAAELNPIDALRYE
jgi:putative ABC transport system permease protein